jgi:hypothetical protein
VAEVRYEPDEFSDEPVDPPPRRPQLISSMRTSRMVVDRGRWRRSEGYGGRMRSMPGDAAAAVCCCRTQVVGGSWLSPPYHRDAWGTMKVVGAALAFVTAGEVSPCSPRGTKGTWSQLSPACYFRTELTVRATSRRGEPQVSPVRPDTVFNRCQVKYRSL